MQKTGTTALLMVVMSALLIQGAFFAATSAAGEYDPGSVVWLNIGIDALMTLALAALALQLRGSGKLAGLAALALPLAVLGVIAGLVKLGIRFTSDHAWWTGNYLPPVF